MPSSRCKRTYRPHNLTDAELLAYLEGRLLPEVQGCKLWPFKGRGTTTYRGRKYLVSHLMFYLREGRWPRPMLLHTCDNERCHTKEHLYEGDHLANGRDILVRDRMPHRIVNYAQRVNILADNRPYREIAVDYGLTAAQVGAIKRKLNGKTPYSDDPAGSATA